MTSPFMSAKSQAKQMPSSMPRSTISHILIPFDGESTESAARYVRHGAQLARALRAKVTLMHVSEPVLAEEYEDEEHRAAAELTLKKENEKAVRRVKQIAESCQISNQLVQVEGHASQRILSHECDLVVMGAHSRKAAECCTIGSVVQGVLRESAVPVLAMRSRGDDGDSPADGPASPGTGNLAEYRRILVGYDGTALGDNAILKAAPLARAMRSEVTLVYVLDQSLYPDEANRRRQAELAEGFLKRGKAVAEQEGISNVKTLLESTPRHAADHLIALSNSRGTDLIVVGTHGRRGVDRRLMGSVAEGLLRMASKPVLVVTYNNLRKDNGDSLNTAYAAIPLANQE